MEEKKKPKVLKIIGIVALSTMGLYVVFMLALTLLVKGLMGNLEKEGFSERNESAETIEERRKSEALAYLEERYGEEFVIDYYRAPGYAYDYVQMFAYPKGKEDEEHKFEIQGRRNKKVGKVEYTDTYVMVKLTEEYKACVDDIVDEYFDDYKLFLEFYSEWMMSNLPPDTKVEDLFEMRANVDYPLPYLDIFLPSSQQNKFTYKNYSRMCEDLAKWGYRGRIYITQYSNDEYFRKKNNENKGRMLKGERNNRQGHTMFIENENTILYD